MVCQYHGKLQSMELILSVADLASGKVGSCLGRQIFRGGNFRPIFY
jgi:hypothetical protein